MRRIAAYLTLAVALATLAACVVAPARPAGCVWVPGHYGPMGRWIPGHCR